MNTHMYSHPFTAEHLQALQEKLGYLISGPQGAGMLACGDEGGSNPEGFELNEQVQAK